MNRTKYLAFVAALALIFNFSITNNNVTYAAPGDAQWAKSTGAGSAESDFAKVSADSSGNTYAVGSINGTSEFDFGNSVTVTGGFASENALIVKYNSSGVAQWARSTEVAPGNSYFEGVSIDSSGNTYAAGYITGTGEFNFGNSVTVTGGSASGNVVIVKYNSSGIAQWAKSTVVGPDYSIFYAATTDNLGNIYAAGEIEGTDEYDFGNSVTVTGGSASSNVVIVKYNSSGIAQWARTAVVGPDWSEFYGVATDNLGNIYAVGEIDGTGEFDFGNNVTATPGYVDASTVIVKYNSSGIAQWAKSTVVGPDYSIFYGVTTDNLGNIYAVGEIDGIGEFDFGNSVTVTGGSASENVVIVKYNSSGIAQWARTAVVGPDWSYFNDVFADPYGNIYAAGEIDGTDEYDFGNNVTATPGNAYGSTVIVKYNSNGVAQWAKSTVVGPDYSIFYAVTTDNLGNIYAVGEIDGTDEYDFGNNVTVMGGSASGNAVIVKYVGDAPPTFSDLPGENQPVNITEGQTITTNPYIIRVKPTDDVGITKVEFYADNNLICTNTTANSNGIYSCDWDTSKYYSEVRVIAYDTAGQTATITRSTTVRLADGTILPETGSNNGKGFIAWLFVALTAAVLGLKKVIATQL